MSDFLHSRALLPLIPPAPFSHKGRRGSLGVLMTETEDGTQALAKKSTPVSPPTPPARGGDWGGAYGLPAGARLLGGATVRANNYSPLPPYGRRTSAADAANILAETGVRLVPVRRAKMRPHAWFMAAIELRAYRRGVEMTNGQPSTGEDGRWTLDGRRQCRV